MRQINNITIISLLLTLLIGQSNRETLIPGSDRSEGQGPFKRMVIRGATMINGNGSPPVGPVDIVIEKNRITEVKSVGYPGVPIKESRRPKKGDYEIDASGHYVLPGFVDLHVHAGNPQKAPDTDYVYKLWLAHGVTTVRGVGLGPLEFTLKEKARSKANKITAPRIWAYHRPGQGKDWKGGPIRDPENARKWVRYIANKGVDGLKLGSYDPVIMAAQIGRAHV